MDPFYELAPEEITRVVPLDWEVGVGGTPYLPWGVEEYGADIALANWGEMVQALYDVFDAQFARWELDPTVTTPGSSKGFVVRPVGKTAPQIMIADPAQVGGTYVDGTALIVNGTGPVCTGIDPGGGTTDITSAGWSPGSRWSQWVGGPTAYISLIPISHIARYRVVADSRDGWLVWRVKRLTNYRYGLAGVAGWAIPLSSYVTGYSVVSAYDMENLSEAAADTRNRIVEVASGEWATEVMIPGRAGRHAFVRPASGAMPVSRAILTVHQGDDVMQSIPLACAPGLYWADEGASAGDQVVDGDGRVRAEVVSTEPLAIIDGGNYAW